MSGFSPSQSLMEAEARLRRLVSSDDENQFLLRLRLKLEWDHELLFEMVVELEAIVGQLGPGVWVPVWLVQFLDWTPEWISGLAANPHLEVLDPSVSTDQVQALIARMVGARDAVFGRTQPRDRGE